MSKVIGIDFGTSSCRVAYMEGGSPMIVSNRLSEGKMPFIMESSNRGDFLLGDNAIDTKPIWSFNSIKQKIGFEETVSMGGKKCLVIDLAADVFSALKEDAEEYVGGDVYGAVVTVPSCFAEKQRAAIRTAVEKSGFGTVRLLDESMAAVLASGVKEEEKTVLVYALGGGVFTSSVFKINNGVPQPLWHEGDRKLGGNDFDALIATHIMGKLNSPLDLSTFKSSHTSIQRLKFHAEQAKIGLSEKTAVEIGISLKDFFAPKDSNSIQKELKFTLTRSEFESMVSQHIENTISLTKKAIQKSGLTKEDIGTILLVGGSTRIPIVEKMIREEFGNKITKAPDELIVTGAAMYAAQLPEMTKKEDKQPQQKDEPSTPDIGVEIPKRIETIQTEEMKWLKEFSPYMAQSFWQSGKQDKAIDTLESLLKELPKFIANLYYERGKELLDADNIDGAFLYLEKGLIHNKSDRHIQRAYHKACNMKGSMLANSGNLLEAKSIIKKGLKYNPDCSGCKDLLAKIKDAIKKQRYPGMRNWGGLRKKRRR